MGVEARLATLFRALCLALTGRGAEVDWAAFSASEWGALVQIAQDQGVAPLLYRTFTDDVWPSNIPAKLCSFLETAYYTSAAQNALLYGELERILAGLGEAGIRVILLKGAALAVNLYPDIAVRPMHDLDLMVRKEQLSQAIARLAASGYHSEAEWTAPEIRRGYRDLFFFEANLDRDWPPPVHVELHWSLNSGEASYYYPDIAWFWQRVETAATDNFISNQTQVTYLLNPTANTLFLAAHLMLKHGLFKHGISRARLIWSYDLHLIISQYSEQIDWRSMAQAALRFNWSHAVQAALQNTRKLFDTRLPEGVLEQFAAAQDRRSQRLEKRRARPVQTRLLNTLDDLSMIRWRWRLWLLGCLFFPDRDYMIWRYRIHPVTLWPAYYPYRWLDVLRDAVQTLSKVTQTT